MDLLDQIQQMPKPELASWTASEDEIYYVNEGDFITARYDKLGMEPSPLQTFFIRKNHYEQRMDDIIKHTNYFLTFYDIDKESFMAIMSIKWAVDRNTKMSQKAFSDLVIRRMITSTFISKCKMMAHTLYKININTDKEGKYQNSPKITNAQAAQILALSFCFRFVLPVCIHYSNVASCFTKQDKTAYLDCFDRIFTRIVELFEKDDVHVYTAICQFIKFRVDKACNNHRLIYYQKKQIRGDSPEIYTEDIIHKVIFVKSLYKLDYRKSCVSFIDGVVKSYNYNYRRENYSSKPYEIDSPDTARDSDDFVSHAEQLEMQVYRIDESNVMIDEVNTAKVLAVIDRNFSPLKITDDELRFYYDNCKINEITQFLLHCFYSKQFSDGYAIYQLNYQTMIRLLVYMKKFFALKGLTLLSQISTAKIFGRYRENMIKNTRFIEKFSTSSVYQSIVSTKFRYLKELNPKDDPILRKLSAIINCTFVFVDYDPDINGIELTDIDNDQIINEFLTFLSIT